VYGIKTLYGCEKNSIGVNDKGC